MSKRTTAFSPKSALRQLTLRYGAEGAAKPDATPVETSSAAATADTTMAPPPARKSIQGSLFQFGVSKATTAPVPSKSDAAVESTPATVVAGEASARQGKQLSLALGKKGEDRGMMVMKLERRKKNGDVVKKPAEQEVAPVEPKKTSSSRKRRRSPSPAQDVEAAGDAEAEATAEPAPVTHRFPRGAHRLRGAVAAIEERVAGGAEDIRSADYELALAVQASLEDADDEPARKRSRRNNKEELAEAVARRYPSLFSTLASRQTGSTKAPLVASVAKHADSLSVITTFAGHDHACYSVCFDEHAEYLLGGGDKGLISLFSTAARGVQIGAGQMACNTWQAHSRWVSEVQFVTQQPTENASLVLTAADDGFVKLWRLRKSALEAAGSPWYIDCVEAVGSLHDGGIYSLHELDGLVATGSKDNSVTLSRVTPSGIFRVKNVAEAHAGTVKCVQLRDGDVMASTGNDRIINIYDHRLAEPIILSIPDTHRQAINSVSWQPQCYYRLLTAAFDGCINFFDLRFPTEPQYTIDAHTSAVRKGIIHPSYGFGGHAVVTPCTTAARVDVYSVWTGRKLRSFGTSHMIDNVEVHTATNRMALLRSKQIIVAQPSFEGDDWD